MYNTNVETTLHIAIVNKGTINMGRMGKLLNNQQFLDSRHTYVKCNAIKLAIR